MDSKALFKLGYGLYVIGTSHDGALAGCTANTVVQITSEPPQIAVGLNKNNYTNQMIHESKKLTVSILDKSADMSLIANFGFQSSRDADKFRTSGQPLLLDHAQAPYLGEHVCAVLSADVVNAVDCGTHTLFICRVTDAQVLGQEEPMTYAYYHSDVKRKKAPAAQGEQWQCSVCGYVHEGPLSEDFVCPVCKQPASAFVKQSAAPAREPAATDGMAVEKWQCTVCGYIHRGPIDDDIACPICKQGRNAFVRIQ